MLELTFFTYLQERHVIYLSNLGVMLSFKKDKILNVSLMKR